MPSMLFRAALVLLATALLVAHQPSSARADATQLCRSISSIVLAPTDVILAPIILAMDGATKHGHNRT